MPSARKGIYETASNHYLPLFRRSVSIGAAVLLGTEYWVLPYNSPVMSTPAIEKKIETLREQIRHHEHLYYVLDAPEISDAAFDKLMNELKRIEAEHPELVAPDSPTQRVGGKPAEGFQRVSHSRPMLSLDNAYTEEELADWDRRVRERVGNLPV